MSNFIYSKMSGKNDPFYGKFEHPIRAIIESESDAYEKQKNALSVLYNIEKSNRYAETVIGESDFDSFQAVEEGARAENDSVEGTFKKVIEHIAFAKEFTITKEMMDDARSGIGANIKNEPRKFVRAYYKTRIKLGSWALANGTLTSGLFNHARVDLSCMDGLSLFHNAHPYATSKMKGKSQSNYYFGDLTTDATTLEIQLGVLSNYMRNFKDENGDEMEYTADIIVIPSNRPHLERLVKKVIGSEREAGNNNNDINTQYGNWTLVVLPNWTTEDDRFMIMSSEANKNLMGNMFYNRIPLDIRNGIDDHTRNFYWNGYCRFGVGFNNWRHILLAVNNKDSVSGATKIPDQAA